MNVIRGTLRFGVLIALMGWVLVIGIPIFFRGGNAAGISRCGDDATCGDVPWGAIWLGGILVILAVGFLTRYRARR